MRASRTGARPRRERRVGWGVLLTLLLEILALPGLAGGSQGPDTPSEVVRLFPTFGHRSGDGRRWVIAVRAWVYRPREGHGEGLREFRERLGLGPDDAERSPFRSRARGFLAHNQDGRRVAVLVAGKVFALGRTGADGHVEGTVSVEAAAVSGRTEVRGVTEGWLPIRTLMAGGQGQTFAGAAQLIGETGLSVISDIDDTIKVTRVSDRRELLANSFLREFQAVPGMAEAYRRWARAGAAFHYVTASPWQLYEPLARFLEEGGFPAGSFHMKAFRWKEASFIRLFASPQESKPAAIEPILAAFPRRRFVLVGDSGERDPEIYGALARKYPDRVAAVFIRAVSGAGLQPERFTRAFDGVARDRWKVFATPEDLGPPSR